jgi:hypothetical protein
MWMTFCMYMTTHNDLISQSRTIIISTVSVHYYHKHYHYYHLMEISSDAGMTE